MLFSLRCLSWLWCSPASGLRPYLVKPKPIFLLSKGAQSSLMQLLQASWGKPGRGHLGRLGWSQNSTVVKQVNPCSRREREALGPHHMLPGQQGSAGCLSGTLPTHLPLFWRPISCWVNTGHGTLSAEWACLLARPQYHLDSSGAGVRVTRVAVLYGWPSWGCYHCPFLEMAEVSSLLSSSPAPLSIAKLSLERRVHLHLTSPLLQRCCLGCWGGAGTVLTQAGAGPHFQVLRLQPQGSETLGFVMWAESQMFVFCFFFKTAAKRLRNVDAGEKKQKLKKIRGNLK